jgi:two-component system, NarL family, sensor kinase
MYDGKPIIETCFICFLSKYIPRAQCSISYKRGNLEETGYMYFYSARVRQTISSMKYWVFTVAIILATASTLFAQPSWASRRDSLLNVLARSKEDTAKVLVMVRLGELYLGLHPDSSVYFAKAFGILSEKLNFGVGKAYSLSMQAFVLSAQNRKYEAIALDLEAIEVLKKTNRKKALANLYNNTAMIYYAQDDIPESLDHYLKAEAMYEQLNDSSSIAFMYGNLATIYLGLREYKTAYLYALRGVLLCRSLHQAMGLGAGLINLASSLVNLQRFDTALVVLKDARDHTKIYEGVEANTKALSLINSVYLGMGKFDLLKINSNALIAAGRAIADSVGVCDGLSGLVEYYFHEKKYALAAHYSRECIGIAKKDSIVYALRAAYIAAARLEMAKGNAAGYDLYNDLRDSIDEKIRSDKVLRNAQELEAKYSLNKKQAEIDSLNKEKKIQQLTLRQRNMINWVLAGVVLVAALIGFLYNRNYRQRKKLLAAKAVLQGQTEERTRLAKDLHDGLGSILSSAKYSFNHMKQNLIISPENAAAFEKSMDMLDKSIAELRRVAHNMMPEALMKFGLDTALKDFCSSVGQSGAVQLTYQSFGVNETTVPEVASASVYRIVQELVNNILKHADATAALVQLIGKDGKLSITVEDNGKGFARNVLENSGGMGYTSLQNRVTYLKGSIDLQTSPGKGTAVHIELPNLHA